jgi:hypothetical protein
MARLINLNLKGGLNVITQGNPESKWPHVLKTANSNSAPVIDFDYSKTSQIDSRLTFTRSTTGTVVDFEGLNKTALANEVRFQGARRVENAVLYSELLTNAAWTKYTGATVVAGATDPLGGTTAFTVGCGVTNAGSALFNTTVIPTVAGQIWGFSIWLKRKTGTSQVSLKTIKNTATNITVTASWQRFYITATCTSVNGYYGINFTDIGDEVDAWRPQVENVTGQANQNPSEYVPTGVLSAPWQGAGKDGVAYKTTTNGNTVSSNVVTEAAGVPLTNAITLLCEEARTNSFKYSQDYSNAYWTKIGATAIDAASITAPDGTLTGNKFTEDTSNGTHRIIPNTNSGFTIVSGAINSISIYIKRGTRRFVMLQITDAAQAINQSFDLQSGTLATYSGDTSRLVKTAVSIIDSGNGWYRVTLSFTATGSPGNIIFPGIYLCSADNNNSYVGTATETMYFWGAQFELSSPNASSYIPTTTAAVTRAVDVASFTGAGLSWYNAQQGTFAITAAGSAFKSPSDFGALSLTYASQTKYTLGYNNSVKNGSTYLYTAATLSNPTEYTGVAVPTTIYVNAAGIANISRFTYYPKALKLNQMAALL